MNYVEVNSVVRSAASALDPQRHNMCLCHNQLFDSVRFFALLIRHTRVSLAEVLGSRILDKTQDSTHLHGCLHPPTVALAEFLMSWPTRAGRETNAANARIYSRILRSIVRVMREAGLFRSTGPNEPCQSPGLAMALPSRAMRATTST
jgi:hypothetical protein